MEITGLHHITLVCADIRRTIDFYSRTLGLRLIKRTVNFDDPTAYHLYFGDNTGRPGTVITFFEWPNAAYGKPGIGGTHHFALQVGNYTGLLKWKRYLVDKGFAVRGPFDREYFKFISLDDPDGAHIEIATVGPGFTVDEQAGEIGQEVRLPSAETLSANRDPRQMAIETWPEPVEIIAPDMSLSRGLHHITTISSDVSRTHAFYEDLLGLHRVKMTASFDAVETPQWCWGAGPLGRPGTLVTAFERDPLTEPRRRIGIGQTHHFAFAIPDDMAQLAWREKLLAAGLKVTPVLDRVYFKSIYTHDPDGHIVELATAGPGFTVDEPLDDLGHSLRLPPWLEGERAMIERALKGIVKKG
jgi:glyoxalase family protein